MKQWLAALLTILVTGDLRLTHGAVTNSPVFVGNWPGYDRFYALDIASADRYVYTANGTAGIRAYEIREGTNATMVGRFDFAGDHSALGIAVAGTNLFVAYGSRLVIFDVSDPAVLKPIGTNTGSAYSVN